MEAVKVAVRVRPFNKREIDRKAQCIIAMDGPVTTITNPETNETKQFTFDHSYWSHNSSQKFADQDVVFNDLGKSVLENAWQGYNVSLFAYGQTGSGKSYSMVGYGADRGIIPCACEELFRRVDDNKDESVVFKVESSMMEIYNERVRDLFNPKNPKNDAGLKVRENPKTGPYVDGLAMLPVKDYEQIDRLMEEGTKARTVAATQMNATSSRAHTIFTIILTQTITNQSTMKVTDKVSKISLVDLAGSERAASTGAQGGRLKEGAAINKSLSALGNCISALADASKPGIDKSKHFIPYRDSALTWLLRESLGGNAKTIMIAALSPADINFEETLSTLRYADRAKQIVNEAVVNEDPNEKMIRELREEVERLRELAAGTAVPAAQLEKLTAAARKEVEEKAELEMQRYKEELEQSQKLIESMSKTWEEKVREASEMEDQRHQIMREMGIASTQDDLSLPQLVNINEDPLKSGAIIYALKEGETTVGRPDAEVSQGIKLVGLNMSKQHAVLLVKQRIVTISKVGNARCWVNGEMLGNEPVTLNQDDRVLLGNNHLFRFNDPTKEQANTTVIDWEFAQRELAVATGQGSLIIDAEREKQAEEMKKRMEELEEKLKKDREEARLKIEAQQAALEDQNQKLNALGGKEREEAQRQLDLERAALKEQQHQLEEKLKAQAAEAEAAKAEEEKKMKERDILHDRILALLPMITETNGICDELDRGIKFDLKIVPRTTFLGEKPKSSNGRRSSIVDYSAEAESVLAVRLSDGSHRDRLWTQEKFLDRIYAIRDYYHACVMMDESGMSEDPFIDDAVSVLVGHAHIYLDSLYHLIDIDFSTAVIDYKGKVDGELSVRMRLTDENNIPFNNSDGSPVDSVEQLLDRNARIHLEVLSGRGFPSHLGAFRLEFKFYESPEVFRSDAADGKTPNPHFGLTQTFTIVLGDEMTEYLLMDALTLQVWAEDAGIEFGKGGTVGKSGKKQLEEEKKQLQLKEQRLQELENALMAPQASRPKGGVNKQNVMVIEEEEDGEDDDMVIGSGSVARSQQSAPDLAPRLKQAEEEARKAKSEAAAAQQEIERLTKLLSRRGSSSSSTTPKK